MVEGCSCGEGILQAASVGLCRLREEKDGKMEVVCLRLLKGLHHKFKVGAVSGSTLYLTSSCLQCLETS